ncbi:hypothetical protein ACMFMF_011816 [Clarireedia jacksonii]
MERTFPDDKRSVEVNRRWPVANDKLKARVDMVYKYVLHITPGKGGLIDIIKDDKASSPPIYDSGKLKLINWDKT